MKRKLKIKKDEINKAWPKKRFLVRGRRVRYHSANIARYNY